MPDSVVNLICMPVSSLMLTLAHKNFASPSLKPFQPKKYTCRFFEFDLLLFQVMEKNEDEDDEEEEIPDFTINLLKFNTNILKVCLCFLSDLIDSATKILISCPCRILVANFYLSFTTRRSG